VHNFRPFYGQLLLSRSASLAWASAKIKGNGGNMQHRLMTQPESAQDQKKSARCTLTTFKSSVCVGRRCSARAMQKIKFPSNRAQFAQPQEQCTVRQIRMTSPNHVFCTLRGELFGFNFSVYSISRVASTTPFISSAL
jgi:hypothetical protein